MQELNQLIGIKLLTLSIIQIFGSLAHFPGEGNARFAPLRTHMIISHHLEELAYDFDNIIFLNMRILEMKLFITALVNKMIVIIWYIHRSANIFCDFCRSAGIKRLRTTGINDLGEVLS